MRLLVSRQFVQTRSDHEARERHGVKTRVQPNHRIHVRRQIGHGEFVFIQNFIAVHQTRDVRIVVTSYESNDELYIFERKFVLKISVLKTRFTYVSHVFPMENSKRLEAELEPRYGHYPMQIPRYAPKNKKQK